MCDNFKVLHRELYKNVLFDLKLSNLTQSGQLQNESDSKLGTHWSIFLSPDTDTWALGGISLFFTFSTEILLRNKLGRYAKS